MSETPETPVESSKVVSNISDLFGTTEALETDGIWIDYGEYGRFLVRRAGGRNRKFKNLMTRLIKPHRAAMQMGAVDDSVLEGLTRHAFSRTVIIDWELVDEDGEPRDFSVSACEELFKELPDLFEDIMSQAQMVVNFVELARDNDAKD